MSEFQLELPTWKDRIRGITIFVGALYLMSLGGLLAYMGFFALAAIAIADLIVGRTTINVPDKLEEKISQIVFFRRFNYISVALVFGFIFFCGYHYCAHDATLTEQLGFLLSAGIISGAVGITNAHELVHKDTATERFFGGFLLSLVCYATFKVEHVRGHHVNVSTPLDQSSARLGQSLYHFLPRAIYGNVTNGFKLEAERLKRKGLPAFHWNNELIWWSLLSVGWAVLFYQLWGQIGLWFFLLQSLGGVLMLEIVNYVEHYGLERRKLDNGKYERVTPQHSWNASEILTNHILINLQRHSDHHAYPKRRYQILRHFDESPQLPTGYAGMLLLALVPPLWFKVMDPMAEEYMENLRCQNEEGNDLEGDPAAA